MVRKETHTTSYYDDRGISQERQGQWTNKEIALKAFSDFGVTITDFR